MLSSVFYSTLGLTGVLYNMIHKDILKDKARTKDWNLIIKESKTKAVHNISG